MALSSEDPVLEANLILTEDDACEDIVEPSNPSITSSGVLFEDHIYRLVEIGPDVTALEGCDSTANNPDACRDHIFAKVTVKPNSSIGCPKL